MRAIVVLLLSAVILVGCGPKRESEIAGVTPYDAPVAEPQPAGTQTTGTQTTVTTAQGRTITISGPATSSGETASPAPGGAGTQATGGAVMRGSNVSSSAGEVGGIVVLWPRAIPSTEDATVIALADALQGRLEKVARRALPHRPVDVRPQPERVCPQSGCLGVSVGVVLAHRDGACVAVVTVAQAGDAPSNLVPWGGFVTFGQPQAPFREPPESYFTVTDFVRCDELMNELDSALVEKTITMVGGK